MNATPAAQLIPISGDRTDAMRTVIVTGFNTCDADVITDRILYWAALNVPAGVQPHLSTQLVLCNPQSTFRLNDDEFVRAWRASSRGFTRNDQPTGIHISHNPHLNNVSGSLDTAQAYTSAAPGGHTFGSGLQTMWVDAYDSLFFENFEEYSWGKILSASLPYLRCRRRVDYGMTSPEPGFESNDFYLADHYAATGSRFEVCFLRGPDYVPAIYGITPR